MFNLTLLSYSYISQEGWGFYFAFNITLTYDIVKTLPNWGISLSSSSSRIILTKNLQVLQRKENYGREQFGNAAQEGITRFLTSKKSGSILPYTFVSQLQNISRTKEQEYQLKLKLKTP